MAKKNKIEDSDSDDGEAYNEEEAEKPELAFSWTEEEIEADKKRWFASQRYKDWYADYKRRVDEQNREGVGRRLVPFGQADPNGHFWGRDWKEVYARVNWTIWKKRQEKYELQAEADATKEQAAARTAKGKSQVRGKTGESKKVIPAKPKTETRYLREQRLEREQKEREEREMREAAEAPEAAVEAAPVVVLGKGKTTPEVGLGKGKTTKGKEVWPVKAKEEPRAVTKKAAVPKAKGGKVQGKDGVLTEEEQEALDARHGVEAPKVDGLTRAAVRRIARRAGCKRISSAAFEPVQAAGKKWVEDMVWDLEHMLDMTQKRTITSFDVLFVLKRHRQRLFGFWEKPGSKPIHGLQPDEY